MKKDKWTPCTKCKGRIWESRPETHICTEKKLMTIAETKIGVTMVLSKQECEKLGFSLNMTTKEVIQQVKNILYNGVKQ